VTAARTATSGSWARRRWWALAALVFLLLVVLLATGTLRWGTPTMTVEPPVVHAGDPVTVTVQNTTTSRIGTGYLADVTRWDGGSWVAADPPGLTKGILPMYVLRPLGTHSHQVRTAVEWPAGTYRIGKQVTRMRDDARLDLNAEFEVRHLSEPHAEDDR
jgi:uncharacterized protein (DUF58 family)